MLRRPIETTRTYQACSITSGLAVNRAWSQESVARAAALDLASIYQVGSPSCDQFFQYTESLLAQQHRRIKGQRALRRNPRSHQPQKRHSYNNPS